MNKTQREIRGDLQSHIWEYKRRKDALIVRKDVGTVRTEEALKTHKKELQTKIDNWNRQIKRMDIRKNKIMALGNAVAYFTGINVKGVGEKYLNGVYEATALFSKWGLEHGIAGNFLSEYMEKPLEAAGRTRLAFTRSYDKHPERRELYNRFCTYMEHLQQENIENNSDKH